MKRFNQWVAVKLTVLLSSMWLFWILVIALIVAAILDPPSTPYTIVMFVISAAFQAIALPVLALTSSLQGDRQERVTSDTHKMTIEELQLIKKQLEMTRKEMAMLNEVLKEKRK
ncbi:hypothetical protein FWC63_02570 [Candidatus Saccharibacteria bacterium]|nr:hypothetical protein [Candidatus Saccharibacteria bacterium]